MTERALSVDVAAVASAVLGSAAAAAPAPAPAPAAQPPEESEAASSSAAAAGDQEEDLSENSTDPGSFESSDGDLSDLGEPPDFYHDTEDVRVECETQGVKGIEKRSAKGKLTHDMKGLSLMEQRIVRILPRPETIAMFQNIQCLLRLYSQQQKKQLHSSQKSHLGIWRWNSHNKQAELAAVRPVAVPWPQNTVLFVAHAQQLHLCI